MFLVVRLEFMSFGPMLEVCADHAEESAMLRHAPLVCPLLVSADFALHYSLPFDLFNYFTVKFTKQNNITVSSWQTVNFDGDDAEG